MLEIGKLKELVFKLARSELLRIIFLYLGVLVLFYPSIFFDGEVFAPTDLLFRYAPWRTVSSVTVENTLRSDILDVFIPIYRSFSDAVKQGEVPLWSINNSKPLLVSFTTGLYFPTSLLYLFLETDLSFTIANLSKYVIAGTGMYFLLADFGIQRRNAFIAGIIYMFSAFNVVWLFWPHANVSAMMPLLILSTYRVIKNPNYLSSLCLAIAIFLMMAGGFPSVALYGYFSSGVFFFISTFIDLLKSHDYNNCGRRIFSYSLGVVWGIGLSMFMVIPFLEYTEFINIGYRIKAEYGGLPKELMLQILFPNIGGNQVLGRWLGKSNYNESASYIGIIGLFLAYLGSVWGFWKKKIPAIVFIILSVFSIFVIYDLFGVAQIISKLPLFNTSPNTRMISLWCFAGSILSGFGLEFVEYIVDSRKLTLKNVFLIIFLPLVSFVFLSVVLIKGKDILSMLTLDSFRKISALGKYAMQINSLGNAIFLLSAFTLGLSIFLLKKNLKKMVMSIFFILLILFDAFTFSIGQNATVPKEQFYPTTESISFLKENLNEMEKVAIFDMTFFIPGTQRYYGINSIFNHGFHSVDHKELLNAWVEDAWASPTAILPKSSNADFSSPLVDLMGVRYITTSSGEVDIRKQPIASNTSQNAVTARLTGVDVAKQTFQLELNENLSRPDELCLLLGNYRNTSAGNLNVHIFDEKPGGAVWESLIDMRTTKDNDWNCMQIESFVLENNHVYGLEVRSDSNSGVSWYYNSKDSAYPFGEGSFNNEIVGDFAFAFYGGDDVGLEYDKVYEGEGLVIYENLEGYEPYLATTDIVVEDIDECVEVLNSNSFQVGKSAVVNNDLIKDDGLGTGGEVGIISYTNNSVEFITDSDTESILVTSELYYPGWEVYVDGKKGDIIKVNGIFRGAYLEEGEHQIEFRYEPKSFFIGLKISGGVLVIILSVLIYKWLRKKTSGNI